MLNFFSRQTKRERKSHFREDQEEHVCRQNDINQEKRGQRDLVAENIGTLEV